MCNVIVIIASCIVSALPRREGFCHELTMITDVDKITISKRGQEENVRAWYLFMKKDL